MNTLAIELPIDKLVAFCKRWHITELAAFGSVTRADFRQDSDIDLLATFADNVEWSLLDGVQMNQEIEQLLQRPIDLISRSAVLHSANTLRRNAILASSQTIYVSSEAHHAA